MFPPEHAAKGRPSDSLVLTACRKNVALSEAILSLASLPAFALEQNGIVSVQQEQIYPWSLLPQGLPNLIIPNHRLFRPRFPPFSTSSTYFGSRLEYHSMPRLPPSHNPSTAATSPIVQTSHPAFLTGRRSLLYIESAFKRSSGGVRGVFAARYISLDHP